MLVKLALRSARTLLVVAAAAMTACSTSSEFTTNSINSQLNNSDSRQIESSERSLEKLKLEAISASLPVCIAYRMPVQGQPVTAAMSETVSTVARALRKHNLAVGSAEIRHARYTNDTAGSFPTDQVVPVSQLLSTQFPGVSAEYRPIPKESFRSSSNCGEKDSAFVDLERLTFYRTVMPAATVWQGKLSIRDVMFIVLNDKTINTAGKS